MISLMITLESEDHKATLLEHLGEGEMNGPLLFDFSVRVLDDNEVSRIRDAEEKERNARAALAAVVQISMDSLRGNTDDGGAA